MYNPPRSHHIQVRICVGDRQFATHRLSKTLRSGSGGVKQRRTLLVYSRRGYVTDGEHEFQQEPVQEQLYHQYFRAAEDDVEGEWMLAVEIFQYLQKKSGIKLPVGKMNMFGRFLSKLGVLRRRTRNGVYYRVVGRMKNDLK